MDLQFYYYPNGNIKFESTYHRGVLNGTSKHYFENGKLKSEATYEFGLLNGDAHEYYSDGNIKSTVQFIKWLCKFEISNYLIIKEQIFTF